ncbi:MAG: SRPBCC family protein [Gaiellaceae bacterium]
MPRVSAERELLAPRDDVWAFLAEPHHLPDWWPGIAGVRPDRRGLAPGARWQVSGVGQPTLLRSAHASGQLLVRTVEKPSLVAWHLTSDRLDVELRLDAPASDRTLARLTVSGGLLLLGRRGLPREALSRLHALCQTAASL